MAKKSKIQTARTFDSVPVGEGKHYTPVLNGRVMEFELYYGDEFIGVATSELNAESKLVEYAMERATYAARQMEAA